MDKLDKRFYKIGDVAEILHIPESTLRYWEKQFTIINPRRNAKNTRLYTPADIEVIRKNRDGIDKRYEVVTRLKEIRDQLKELQKALDSIKV